MLKQVRDQQGRLTNRSMDSIMQQMRDVINAKETTAAGQTSSSQPTTQQQQQQMVTPTTAASNESPTPTGNVGGKVVSSKKQLPMEKVTVRTLPKKQVTKILEYTIRM